MSTLLISHPTSQRHDVGPGHPECIGRIEAVLGRLKAPEFAALERRLAAPADDEALLAAHSPSHLAAVADAARSGKRLDPDTVIGPHSESAARCGAGAVIDAVDAVFAGDATNAFCAVRPPGHHAETDRVMGFCLYNAAVIGAFHAARRRLAKRIALIDFDVHHGNGIEQILLQRSAEHPDCAFLYASSHEHPLYPGTGLESQKKGNATIVNLPLPAQTGGEDFRRAFAAVILPAIDAFQPDLSIVSAGFDAHRDDPLANLNLEGDDYRWLSERLVACAQRHGQGRLISTLEGGYGLEALADAAAQHVGVLLKASA